MRIIFREIGLVDVNCRRTFCADMMRVQTA
jgi:hypothetical protein